MKYTVKNYSDQILFARPCTLDIMVADSVDSYFTKDFMCFLMCTDNNILSVQSKYSQTGGNYERRGRMPRNYQNALQSYRNAQWKNTMPRN